MSNSLKKVLRRRQLADRKYAKLVEREKAKKARNNDHPDYGSLYVMKDEPFEQGQDEMES